MAFSKGTLKIRRTIKKRSHAASSSSSSSCPMGSLPKELLVEIIARVAAESSADLHRSKICCKDFHDAAEDRYSYKHASLKNFPVTAWFPNRKKSLFLERCRESGNLESSFREGLVEYFSRAREESGLAILKEAAGKGHREAKYVYGIILLSCEDEEKRKEGAEYLRFLRMAKCVVGCRDRVKRCMERMWVNNHRVARSSAKLPICRSVQCNGMRVKKGRWVLSDDEDEDDEACENCRWDFEIKSFF